MNEAWSVTTRPATDAEVRVEIAPEMRAEMASLETSPPRPGATCESTPIWVPTEPKLAKPQRA